MRHLIAVLVAATMLVVACAGDPPCDPLDESGGGGAGSCRGVVRDQPPSVFPCTARCEAGAPVRIVVFLRVFDHGSFGAACDPDLDVSIDGHPAGLLTCLTGGSYRGVYSAWVAMDFGLYAVDVKSKSGRRVSVGQEVSVTEGECEPVPHDDGITGGESWHFVSVEIVE